MKGSSIVMVLSVLQLAMLVASQGIIQGPLPGPLPGPALPPTIPAPTLSPAPGVPPPARIDTHNHYVPPFYRSLLETLGITAGGLPIPEWNVSAHLAVNAEFGIQTSVISVSTPGAVLAANPPVQEARSLARQLNEFGYNLTVEYPKKFLFWATLVLPDVNGSIAEAIYALDTLGAAGVILEASTYGTLLGTPAYAPLYKLLNDRNATVFVHPSTSPCAVEEVFTANSTDIPPFVIDFLLDTSRAALNLVFRNVTVDYPNITWILAHSGGFLPFAATRAAGGLALLANNFNALPIYLEELSKFHVDLAISATPTALPSTLAYFNKTRITYGSDFPYSPVAGIQRNNADINSAFLGSNGVTEIDYSNAFALFSKFLQ